MSENPTAGSTPNVLSPSPSEASGMTPPTWESDKDIKECNQCEKEFGVFRRKHHCRGCGLVFCDDCTPKKLELPPEFKQEGKQRVCHACYLTIMQAKVEANPDAHPPKPDFVKLHIDLKLRLQALVSDETKKWAERSENKGVKLFTLKEKDSPLWFVKSVVVIPLPLEKVFTIYQKKELWRNWQPDMTECRTIEALSQTPGEESEVLYITYNLPVIDNRDTLVYSAVMQGRPLTDGRPDCKTIISQSVTHPLCPLTKKFVRAHLSMGLTVFSPVGDGDQSTEIMTILHADPRGLVPPFVVNQTFSKAADSIADMRAYMIKNPDA